MSAVLVESRGIPGRISRWRVLILETQMEFLRLLRAPSFSVPTLAFPVLFYLLFGVALGNHHDPMASRQLLARFTVFGIMAPALFGFGITVALERERGLLMLKRALPMPPGVYLAAKLVTAFAFAALISAVLMLVAVSVGHVMLPLLQWCVLFIVGVLGVIPFCALGLLIGTLTRGQAAPAVSNLVYLPMSFLSGLLVPLPVLPHGLAQLAPFLPAFHLAQLALAAVGAANDAHPAVNLLILSAVAAAGFALAQRQFRRLG